MPYLSTHPTRIKVKQDSIFTYYGKKSRRKSCLYCALYYNLCSPKKTLLGDTLIPDFKICYYEKVETHWNITVIFKVLLLNLGETQRDFKLFSIIFF